VSAHQAYPLSWPQGWSRNKDRVGSQFKTAIGVAVRNVQGELRLFGKDTGFEVTDVLISSNVSLMNENPDDPGVAVYFRWDKTDCCFAVDRYRKPACNLQAIARVIEAERTKMRHGGLNIVRASFRGYAALPPPKGADAQIAKPWRQVLGVPENAPLLSAEARYRELAKKHHPDKPGGGDPAAFNLITDAIRQARQELS